ncbi:MAG TPA: SusC/RagA family TonB-linked outer membrane protein [Gemmatimonadaceae bacterium]|nr:SusC/RagA family TonB-linked outer membrane protein [Gemmatimonadaceae bacterium]
MKRGSVVRLTIALALAGASLFAAPTARAQQSGTITGRVVDEVSGEPVVAAQLSVVGTSLGAQTNQQGQYTIRNVPAGAHRVRAIRVGYAEVSDSVTVPTGGSVTLDLQMHTVAVTLTPVVTTATGEQRRIEVGNAVGQIQAAEVVQTQAVQSVGDLLTARTPGVQVLGGNMTGAGSRVRIRGNSSLSLSNEPIYIIDGIRMESSTNSTAIGVGGTTPSRVNDLNPDEIENIEVIRGPSAATLYGTDAANGVIVITTKRGRAGRPQWRAYVEQGLVYDNHDWPSGFYSFSAPAAPDEDPESCYNYLVASGDCTIDSSFVGNPATNDSLTPLGTGHRQQYGLQVAGGSEAVRYFVSGEWERELGLLEMPSAGRNRLEADGVNILEHWERPNTVRRASGRANLDIALSPKADLTVSTNYIALEQRFPQSDNNVNAWGPTLFASTSDGSYGFFDPADSFQDETWQDVDRLIGQIGTNVRPTSWLSLRGNFGLDYTSRVDQELCRFNTCADFGTNREGFKEDTRTNFYQYTADVAATGTFQLTPMLNSRTTAGVQFFRNLFDQNSAEGDQLPPGATQTSAAAVLDASESTSDSRTLGAYIEESLAWQDKLFVTGAIRTDRNSAFGRDFSAVYYPKLSVSYVISSEPWFPQPTWMNQLRLRSAYGASGRQPNPNDAAQFFSTITTRLDATESPGIVFNALGNPNLKPERSTELEVGIDGTFWDNRLNTEFTYYHKDSRDALIDRVLPPSLGIGSTSRLENLGQVVNQGVEGLVNAQLVDGAAFAWDVTLNGSHNTNELVELGKDIPPIIGTTIREIEGYPLFGYWERPFTYADADGDGLISETEIDVAEDAVFLGYSIPKTELAFVNGFEFWNRRFRLQALIDYKGGHKLYNNTERFRCVDAANCSGIGNPNASLFEQARAVAARVGEDGTERTLAGYIEDASFIRFRELSLTFTAPASWASRLGGRTLSATLAGRNLGFITDYTGLDPESNYGQGNVPADFLTQPPPSYVTFRINFGF